ncbi:MAG: adenosylcobinamide-GDP ribazoletransferase [Paracoccaceae bacterium]
MPGESDSPLHASDIAAAVGLMTRLPVPLTARAAARGARAAWAWPLAGALAGGLAALVALAAMATGLAPGLAAGLALTVQVMLTGALHEDGLADTADGFWGGHDPARRLEIMKDSHIGSYGVIALILSLGLRWQALALLCATGPVLPALVATAALSRAPMAVLMQTLPNARGSGLSASVGTPGGLAAGLGAGLALFIAVVLTGLPAFAAAAAVILVSIAIAALALHKIDGQTGDVLGATQQISEIASLLALAALMA